MSKVECTGTCSKKCPFLDPFSWQIYRQPKKTKHFLMLVFITHKMCGLHCRYNSYVLNCSLQHFKPLLNMEIGAMHKGHTLQTRQLSISHVCRITLSDSENFMFLNLIQIVNTKHTNAAISITLVLQFINTLHLYKILCSQYYIGGILSISRHLGKT